MNRRALLVSGGIALSTVCAGCLGGVAGSRAPDRTTPYPVELNDGGPKADRLVNAWSHSDVPPYGISGVETLDSEADWTPTYLGDGMATAPSLPFVQRAVDRDRLREPARFQRPTVNSYSLALIGSESERDRLLKPGGEPVDFEESVLVLVGECCGSGSVIHEWVRVEEGKGGIHLFGYHREPYLQTSDLRPRYSLLEIDRPADRVGTACASLTVGEQRRVHFDSTVDALRLVPAVMANDLSEAVTGRLRITTADGERRVNDSFIISAGTEWKRIGLVGERADLFTVELTIDALDIDLSEEYPADGGTLGIRIRNEGNAVVGRSDEI